MRRRHASAVVALACGVALAARVGLDTAPRGGPAAPPGVLLGLANEGGARWLVRVAPVSLRPLAGGRLRLEAPLEAWALSPDESRLAAVSDGASVLRLIDVGRMRTLRRLRTRARGAPVALVWPRPDRLWIVLASPGCCAARSTTLVTVDPIAQRVVARRRLAGGVARVAASPDGPVLVLAPPTIGPARLATVDTAGAVWQLPLDGVSAGAMPTEVVPAAERVRAPALAVDPGRRRAYVVSARPYAVEIDLRRRRVSGHRLADRASLLDRLRELLEPSAAADVQVGPVRTAAWIGAERIAVSGYDGHVVWHPDGRVEGERRPAGLHVIDTRDWRVRTVDERASGFVASAGLLLTSGQDGRGLAGYSPDGDERFHVLDDRHVEIAAIASSVAYVRVPPEPALRAVYLASGRLLGTSAPGRATLLLERAAAGWE